MRIQWFITLRMIYQAFLLLSFTAKNAYFVYDDIIEQIILFFVASE